LRQRRLNLLFIEYQAGKIPAPATGVEMAGNDCVRGMKNPAFAGRDLNIVKA